MTIDVDRVLLSRSRVRPPSSAAILGLMHVTRRPSPERCKPVLASEDEIEAAYALGNLALEMVVRTRGRIETTVGRLLVGRALGTTVDATLHGIDLT